MRGQDSKRSRAGNQFSFHAFRLLFLVVLIFTALSTTVAASNPSRPERRYPTGSWAVGVVVSEGAGFADDGRLSWLNATAVSATVTLPNISLTDYPLYAVESVMAADGSILQVAAGLYPNNTRWHAYGWYVANTLAQPQNYVWVLNASKPEMMPGASVSLSISLVQDRWQYNVEDLSTRTSIVGDYPTNVSPVLRTGDQEVFALESYSTSNVVFAQMGNLTLDTLRINGKQIVTGWYEYGAWQTRETPLFVVGGLDPPPYIYLQKSNDSTWVWSYEQWSGYQGVPPPPPSTLAIVVGVPLVALFLASVIMRVKKRQRHR